MKYSLISVLLFALACSAQDLPEEVKIGGRFENDDLFYQGMPSSIYAIDTCEAWWSGREKLIIEGQTLSADGRTPVPDVVIYYYHTNEEGRYNGKTKHGDLRGWVQSDNKGKYRILTAKPAPYPSRAEPAHIHLTVLEPKIGTPYYIDALVFDDDRAVNTEYRERMENRGGSGVLRTKKDDEIEVAQKNIILGLKIPNHPDNPKITSGKFIGEDLTSFTPRHLWGPEKGKSTCPICKYGKYKGLLFFAGSASSLEEIQLWVDFLEGQCDYTKRPIFFIFDESNFEDADIIRLGKNLSLSCVGLAMASNIDLAKNQVDPEKKNTIILYNKSNVYDKFIDLKPTTENLKRIQNRLLDKTSQ